MDQAISHVARDGTLTDVAGNDIEFPGLGKWMMRSARASVMEGYFRWEGFPIT
jgi:hypothetical protein